MNKKYTVITRFLYSDGTAGQTEKGPITMPQANAQVKASTRYYAKSDKTLVSIEIIEIK